MRVLTFSRGVTAKVAQTVDDPEATWVWYFLSSLLRVDSSMVQALEDGMVSGAVLVVEERGACSGRLSRVMPEDVPSEQPQLELFVAFDC
jgi:hypothetical protein